MNENNNIPEISESQTNNIVDAACHLISALKEAYGPEKASELYQQFDEHLGGAAGLAILRILCGDYLNITLRFTGPVNKITLIKAIRCSQLKEGTDMFGNRQNFFKLGLKDAKDIVDGWYQNIFPNCNFSVSWSCTDQDCLNSFIVALQNEPNVKIF